MRNTRPASTVVWIVLITLLGVLPSAAHAARTNPKKTYWHSVGNDRFRAYDVGGLKQKKTFHIPVPPWEVTVPWDSAEPPAHVPGPSPYRSSYSDTIWRVAGKWAIRQSNKAYAARVDWPVTMIFKNEAWIDKVKKGLSRHELSTPGSTMYLALADSASAGSHEELLDADGGLKEVICSGLPGAPDTTNHIRLYADSKGRLDPSSSRPKRNRDDMLANRYWGYYVLATTHLDYQECGGAKRFGWSEVAASRILNSAVKGAFGAHQDSCYHNGKWYRYCYHTYNMRNKEKFRLNGDHRWESDGQAIVVKVGDDKPRVSASSNEEDEELEQEEGGGEEGGGEPPPPLEPAIDGDVNGDDQADVVTLDTSGTAHVFDGATGGDTQSFAGTMDPALFDGTGHHLIDVADVDADGYSDLVTLHNNRNVYVYPGQGTGAFGNAVVAGSGFSVGTFGPSGHEPIAVSDVTGDGRTDLVTFYAPQGNFYVYPGRGDRTFGTGITRGGGQIGSALFDRQGYYFVDAGDVTGDGYSDVTVMTTSETSNYGRVLTFRGGPDGLSQHASEGRPVVDTILPDGIGHEPLGLGDVNGDGKADFVALSPAGSVNTYAGKFYLNPNTGNYEVMAESPVTSLSGQNSGLMDEAGDDFVGLLDKTGDGRADLVKVTGEGKVMIAPGQANLTFGAFALFREGVQSNRFDVRPGHEMAQEKPFLRRIGCGPWGCAGRPQPTESDVNGDRRSDLVTVDVTGTAHTYPAVGAAPHATSQDGSLDSALYDGKGKQLVDAADVTGDRRADLVILDAESEPARVSAYPGRGDGRFAAPITSNVGSKAASIHRLGGIETVGVADVTGDGHGDLVLYKAGEGVKVHPGNGLGAFGAAITSLSTLDQALFDDTGYHFLDVIDVGGDQRADLVAIQHGGTIRVYNGTAAGEFTTDQVINLNLNLGDGTGQEPLGVADVNGDWLADFVTYDEGSINVFSGQTSGGFDAFNSTTITPNGSIANEDGDGQPNAKSFDGALDSNLLDGVGDEMVGLLDENGDRKADLVTVREDGTVRVYRGRADLTFATVPQARLLEDFTPGRFHRMPGHEVVTEKPYMRRAGCGPIGCQWPPRTIEGDVDGDRRGDLVTVTSSGTANVFTTFTNGIGMTYITASSKVQSLLGQNDPALFDGAGAYVVDANDVTGEGRSDLVTISSTGAVTVHPGQADRTFGEGIRSPMTVEPLFNHTTGIEPVAIADVQGDGHGDLVGIHDTGTPASTVIVTYLGQADGTFVSEPISSLSHMDTALKDGTGQYFLDVDDVEGDGLADLVSITNSGQVRVYKGLPNGAFGNHAVAATVDPVMDNGTGEEPAAVGDVNGDERADLVTAAEGTLKLYAGKSDATFAAAVDVYKGTSTKPTIDSNLLDGVGLEFGTLIDYNWDGKRDLVAAFSSGSFSSYTVGASGAFEPSGDSITGSRSTRFDYAPGYEFAGEKPILNRQGCTVSGCRWKTTPSVDSDVDGDRKADLVALHTDGSAYSYPGTASGFSVAAGIASFSGSLDSALFGGEGNFLIDTGEVMDGGGADLVVVSKEGRFRTAPGKPDGSFGPIADSEFTVDLALEDPVGFEPIGVADVTADGRADMVGFGESEGTSYVATYPGKGDGGFANGPNGIRTTEFSTSVDSALHDGSGQYFLDVTDVSGDGIPDLVALSDTGAVQTFLGSDDGTFSAGTASTPIVEPIMDDGAGQEPVGVADVDGDGRADLVTLDQGLLTLYVGSSDGTFSSGVQAYASTIDSSLLDEVGMELVGLLDHNGDGRADLVAIDPSGDLLTYEAQANGTFASPVVEAASLGSTRFDRKPGNEFVSERTLMRRAGCEATGCAWPPVGAEEPPPEPPSKWTGAILGTSSSELKGVSCPKAGECMAVGSFFDDAGVEKAQSGTFISGTWSRKTTPSPTGAKSSRLVGVSCGYSVSTCRAVGSYVDSNGVRKALVLKWASGAWTVDTGLNIWWASSSEVNGVSCEWTGECIIVGSLVTNGVRKPLFFRHNNTSWTIPSIQQPGGATSSELSAVSCRSLNSGECLAVGNYLDGEENEKVFSLRWNGYSLWALVSTPNASSSAGSELSAVSCEVICHAVGSFKSDTAGERRPLAMVWNSSTWTIKPVPVPEDATIAELNGVTCNQSGVCVAVGRAEIGSDDPLYAIRWNGTTWSDESVEGPGATDTELAAIGCTEENCAAAGSIANGGPRRHLVASLGEQWNPVQVAKAGDTFGGVECVSSSSCLMVSSSTHPTESATPLAWWTEGASWLPSLTATGPVAPELRDVACSAAGECTAVGKQGSAAPFQALAERWNGTAWSSQTITTPSGRSAFLEGVSCFSSTWCVAAGHSKPSTGTGADLPLVETWNGSAWTVATTPAPSGAAHSYLNDVSCASAPTCMAVGNYVDGEGKTKAFVEQLGSGSWTASAPPAPAGFTYKLFGVSCLSSTDCTAVGEKVGVSATTPLVLGWNGTAWSEQTLPALPGSPSSASLLAVDCYAAGSCAVVGATKEGTLTKPLALSSQEGAWTLETASTVAGSGTVSLDSVACASDGTCQAGGKADYGAGGAEFVVYRRDLAE